MKITSFEENVFLVKLNSILMIKYLKKKSDAVHLEAIVRLSFFFI